MPKSDPNRFAGLKYEDFKALAKDQSLSRYEKIGFPDSYREGKEEAIFADIKRKLTGLDQRGRTVLDIGPGCSGLAFMLIDHCRRQGHKLLLVDSQEMLDHLPDEPFITKVPARFPDECRWLTEQHAGRVDALLCYSVLHYIFAEGNLFDFLDSALALLAHGGQMLLGDIPNLSKRRRFFSSPAGIQFHRDFTGTNETPSVEFNTLESGQIDDAVITSILMRSQASGFDAYCLPQPDELPMANRRDDILIRRP